MNPRIRPRDPTGWRRWTARLLDLFYPPGCVSCGDNLRHGRSLCRPCEEAIPSLQPPFCSTCGESFPGRLEEPFSCPNCARLVFSFEFARPAVAHHELVRGMIHQLKYGRQVHLAQELARLALRSWEDPRLDQPLQERWPLVPVPLHRAKRRQRHFNQAEEIARFLSAPLALPVLRALRRTRNTGTQTRLSRSQRLQNLRSAFAVTRAGRRSAAQGFPGAILVDDVLTTGATADACARTLRQAGFPRVIVVTVMRG